MFKFPWFRRKSQSAAYADTVPVRAPRAPDEEGRTRESGWLLSSADLHTGLQVVEGDERAGSDQFDLPDRRRDPSRRR